MKKIAYSLGLGAIQYYRRGLMNVMGSLGHQVNMFDVNGQKPLLDYFTEYNPDVCVFGSWELVDSRPLFKAIMQRPGMELVMFSPNYGDECKDGSPNDGVLRASEQELRLVEQLVSNNGLNKNFQYYHESDLPYTHGNWKNLGISSYSLPMAADIFIYNLVDSSPEWESDIFFCGGRWPFKAQNLDRFLYPLLMDDNLKIKIFGHGWVNPQCVGPISDENYKFACASAKISPAIYEPLASKGYDISERIFKTMACGSFVISQRVRSAEINFFNNNECIFIDTVEEFRDAVYYFIKNADQRKFHIAKSIHNIYNNHTYHHRVRELASRMGWITDIIKLDNILPEIAKVAENVQ